MELEQRHLEELEMARNEVMNSNLSETAKRVVLESIRKDCFETRTRLYAIQRDNQEHEDYMESHRVNR